MPSPFVDEPGADVVIGDRTFRIGATYAAKRPGDMNRTLVGYLPREKCGPYASAYGAARWKVPGGGSLTEGGGDARFWLEWAGEEVRRHG